MKKTRGVVVGLGYFSQFHLEAWMRLKEVDLVAICDTDSERTQSVAAKFDIPRSYSDVNEMLTNEQPDFIDIITPPKTHLKLCLLAAEKKVNIICQKPLAPSLKEAEEIAAAVSAHGIRMMVHENFRFQPWHREIKKLLHQEIIGEHLHSIHWRMRMGDGWQEDAYMNRQPYFREMKQLLMYETGIHMIDTLRYFGGEIQTVFTKLNRFNLNIKGEDSALVVCDFAQGGTAIIDANRYNESTCENPRLTFGNIQIEANKGSIRLYEDGNITIQLLGEQEKIHPYAFENQNFSGDCVYHTQQHFISQLKSENPFETDVRDYLSNIVILEKIYESNKENRPISV